VQGFQPRHPPERRTPGEHFVQQGTEGVDVGGRPRRPSPPLGLLGSHVAGRAQDGTRLGLSAGVAVHLLGEAEIGDFRPAVGSKEDIGGLEVAVDDTALVGGVDGSRQGFDEAGGLDGRQRLPRQALGQTAPLDVFQDEVRPALVFADFKDLHDIGMLEAGGGLRLGAETIEGVRAAAGVGGDHLEGDHAIEGGLAGPIHHPHAAAADLPQQLEVAEDGGELRRPLGEQCGGRQAQGSGSPPHVVAVGEELLQLGGDGGVLLQELLAVGGPSLRLGPQVIDDGSVQQVLALVGRFGFEMHGPFASLRRRCRAAWPCRGGAGRPRNRRCVPSCG
jgi:hypothetical protein